MLKEGLEEKMDVFSRLEAEFQTLIHFVTPNEAGRIKARLMQIGRYREEFKNSVEQQEAELHSSLKNTKQFIQDLNEVTLHTVHGSIYSSELIYYLSHSRWVLLNVFMHLRWNVSWMDYRKTWTYQLLHVHQHQWHIKLSMNIWLVLHVFGNWWLKDLNKTISIPYTLYHIDQGCQTQIWGH